MTPPAKECKMERDNQPKEKKRPRKREESFCLEAWCDQQQIEFGKPALGNRRPGAKNPNRVYAKENYCGLPFPARLTSVTRISQHAIRAMSYAWPHLGFFLQKDLNSLNLNAVKSGVSRWNYGHNLVKFRSFVALAWVQFIFSKTYDHAYVLFSDDIKFEESLMVSVARPMHSRQARFLHWLK